MSAVKRLSPRRPQPTGVETRPREDHSAPVSPSTPDAPSPAPGVETEARPA